MVAHSRRSYLGSLFIGGATLVAGCVDAGEDSNETVDEEDDEEPEETADADDNEVEDDGENEEDDKTYTLTVTVEDADEVSIEGATVELEEANSDDEMDEDEDAGADDDDGETDEDEDDWEDETDENGQVEFENLEDGDYTVYAEYEDDIAEEDVTIDGDDDEITLILDDDEEIADDEEPENLVIVAPDGDWRFEPEEITIEMGETVTWYFEASGHNVTSHPDASGFVENPEDAEPITSYEGDNHMGLNEPETTHERTFEVPGEYVYVCTPHEAIMVGTVIVEE